MPELSPSLFFPLYALQWIALLFLAALLLGAYNQIGQLQKARTPRASLLRKGDPLPIDLGIPLPAHTFVVLLTYGCSGCLTLVQKLDGLQLGDWSLITLIHGTPLPRETAHLPELHPPTGALPLHDPDNTWFRQLGAEVTPAALAFVGGRLVDQAVAPNGEWFDAVIRRHGVDGKGVMRETPGAAVAGFR